MGPSHVPLVSPVLEAISQVIQFDPIVRSPNNRVLVKYHMAPPHGLLQCSATHKEALLNTFLLSQQQLIYEIAQGNYLYAKVNSKHAKKLPKKADAYRCLERTEDKRTHD